MIDVDEWTNVVPGKCARLVEKLPERRNCERRATMWYRGVEYCKFHSSEALWRDRPVREAAQERNAAIHAAEKAVIAAAEAAYLHEESVAPEDRGESAFIRRAEDLILTICDAVDALRKARTA